MTAENRLVMLQEEVDRRRAAKARLRELADSLWKLAGHNKPLHGYYNFTKRSGAGAGELGAEEDHAEAIAEQAASESVSRPGSRGPSRPVSRGVSLSLGTQMHLQIATADDGDTLRSTVSLA